MISSSIWTITNHFRTIILESCSWGSFFFLTAMKTISSLALLLLVGCAFAQTPRIMHKRMGGTNENFIQTMSDPNALIRQSNFGLPPTIYVKKAVIDSIIVLNDTSVIVVTSQKMVDELDWNQYKYSAEDSAFVCSDSMLVRSLTYDSTGTWQPGRDTLVNHAVFSSKFTCDEIKFKLRNEFNIYDSHQNPMVFIGFDCSKNQGRNRRNLLPLWFTNFPKNPNAYILIFGFISLLYFLFINRKRLSAARKEPQLSQLF